jgi:hypothetical protein
MGDIEALKDFTDVGIQIVIFALLVWAAATLYPSVIR